MHALATGMPSSRIAAWAATSRKAIRGVDWNLALTAIALALAGVLAIQSATMNERGHVDIGLTDQAGNQLVTVVLAVAAMVVMTLPPYRMLQNLGVPLAMLNIGLLVATAAVGVEVKGSTRWLSLGFTRFQPSELAKLLMIISFAALLSQVRRERLPWYTAIWPAIWQLPAVYLIKKQPDLGTALCLLASFIAMLVLRGFSVRILLTGFLALASVVYYEREILLSKLEPYQRKRIESLFNPEKYSSAESFQQVRGIIAVGSGRLHGKGYGQGSQHRLEFVPEKHTDFIIAVVGEDWGFMGVMTILTLLLALMAQLFRIFLRCEDPFGCLLLGGIIAMFGFQMVVNMLMVVGFAPVVGIPLPFITYGRTSLVVSLAAVGLALNIARRT